MDSLNFILFLVYKLARKVAFSPRSYTFLHVHLLNRFNDLALLTFSFTPDYGLMKLPSKSFDTRRDHRRFYRRKLRT